MTHLGFLLINAQINGSLCMVCVTVNSLLIHATFIKLTKIAATKDAKILENNDP